MNKPTTLLALVLVLPLWSGCGQAESTALTGELRQLAQDTEGRMGVYVKGLDSGGVDRLEADRPWYLGSTVKLPVALAILQRVDAGELSLQQELELRDRFRVDSAGELVWAEAGTRYRIDTLLEEMLVRSDSVATDMLIDLLGEDAFNERLQAMAPEGFGRITTLQQVRREIYRRIHPDAERLTGVQITELAAADFGEPRLRALARTLEVPRDSLRMSLDEAYDDYYASGLNSATLEAYGGLLERLARGELLEPASRERLYRIMGLGRYQDYRLQAGLPEDLPVVAKTGTQHLRACHMAILDPLGESGEPRVVAACVEGVDEHAPSERILERIGRLLDAQPRDQAA